MNFNKYLKTLARNFDFMSIDSHKKIINDNIVTEAHLHKFAEKLVQILIVLNAENGNFRKWKFLILSVYQSTEFPYRLKEQFAHYLHLAFMNQLHKKFTPILNNFMHDRKASDCLDTEFRAFLKKWFIICCVTEQALLGYYNVQNPIKWEEVLKLMYQARHADDSILDLYLTCLEQFNTSAYRTTISDAKRLIRLQYEYYNRKDIFRRITNLLDKVYPLRDIGVDVAQKFISSKCPDLGASDDNMNSLGNFIEMSDDIGDELNDMLTKDTGDFYYCIFCQEIKQRNHDHSQIDIRMKYATFDIDTWKKSFCFICSIQLKTWTIKSHFSIYNDTHTNKLVALAANGCSTKYEEYLKDFESNGFNTVKLLDQPLNIDKVIQSIKRYIPINAPNEIALSQKNRRLRKIHERLDKKMSKFVEAFYRQLNKKKRVEVLLDLSRAQDSLEDIFHSILILKATKKLYSKEYRLYADFLPNSDLYKIPMSLVEYQQLHANKKKECYNETIETIEKIYARKRPTNSEDYAMELNSITATILNAFQSNYIPLAFLPRFVRNLIEIAEN